jgi:hypothetical protein
MAREWVGESCSDTYELEADATRPAVRASASLGMAPFLTLTPFSMLEGCDYGSESCVFESRRVQVLDA